MKKKFKRRQFLVNPPFQFRIMGWMTLISLAPVFVFFSAHHYFFWQLEKLGLDLGLSAEHVYFKFLEVQGQKLFLIFIILNKISFSHLNLNFYEFIDKFILFWTVKFIWFLKLKKKWCNKACEFSFSLILIRHFLFFLFIVW